MITPHPTPRKGSCVYPNQALCWLVPKIHEYPLVLLQGWREALTVKRCELIAKQSPADTTYYIGAGYSYT